MLSSSAPSKLVLPFANSGAKNTIPTPSQIGITPGAASLTDGFPPLTRTPVAAGGVPPYGQDMNGILYEVSAIVRWANAGGGYPFDGTFASDSNVGGYPKGARVMRTDGTGYWLNTTDNNTTDPETSGAAAAGWVPDYTNGVSAVTMTSANVTLTAAQYGKPVIVISGTLTANLNLIFPNIVGTWVVINNTTGAYAITCKTAAGTGVPACSAQIIVGDGTNIYAAQNNAMAAPVVCGAHGLAGSSAGAVKTATWTAAELIAETALGGVTFKGKSLSLSFNGATTGANGMDTGATPTSADLYIYAIYNPATATWATLGTTTGNGAAVYGGANMPSGYTASCLIWAGVTNGSGQFVAFAQTGRTIGRQFSTVLNTSVSQASYTSLNIAAAVPKPATACKVMITVASTSTSAVGMTLAANSAGCAQINYYVYGTGGQSSSSTVECLLTEVQTIYYIASVTTGTPTYNLAITQYSF